MQTNPSTDELTHRRRGAKTMLEHMNKGTYPYPYPWLYLCLEDVFYLQHNDTNNERTLFDSVL